MAEKNAEADKGYGHAQKILEELRESAKELNLSEEEVKRREKLWREKYGDKGSKTKSG